MQLVKHFERGYGYAEQIITDDGKNGYLVRFFDHYDSECLFFETPTLGRVLEFVEAK